MAGQTRTFHPLAEDDLIRLAQSIAEIVEPGDVFCLQGPVGAGKTTFARALIKTILVEDEDVPSPTFTLVQTYETRRGPLWHADLYRLGSSMELEELGLTEAFETAICLIEWPEIMETQTPDNAHLLKFEPVEEGSARRLDITSRVPRILQALNEVDL